MNFSHRPVTADDVNTLCSFPQGEQELFFMFPKANFPLTEDGRVYHVGVKRGEGGAAGSVSLCSAATRRR